jgi:RNA polymerase sigma-70 factor, ECF subfamily
MQYLYLFCIYKLTDKMTELELLKYAYDKYAGRMLTVCLRYCHDRGIAEDMLHDGYLQAYKSFNKFTNRGEGSLRAWLERVMANTCLQYLRKKDLLRMSEEIEKSTLANYTLSPEEEEPDDELSALIEELPESSLLKIIAELPIGYRTVFNLYIFENYSHKEIGEMLGINEKSSSSQYFRAKKMLAKMITEYCTEHKEEIKRERANYSIKELNGGILHEGRERKMDR